MKKILDFLIKYALVFNIALFILSFVLFFLPLTVTPKKYIEIGVSSYNAIWILSQNSLKYPEHLSMNYEGLIYLVFFLLLWITQITGIVLSKKRPAFSIISLIPLTVISIYTISIFVANSAIPHIGFFVMLLLFCYYVFESVVFLIPKLPIGEHNPTNK